MRLWWDAMWGIIRRDAILFVSYRLQLVAQFLGLLFSITLFYYISRILTAWTSRTEASTRGPSPRGEHRHG